MVLFFFLKIQIRCCGEVEKENEGISGFSLLKDKKFIKITLAQTGSIEPPPVKSVNSVSDQGLSFIM